uniref:H15 domain-containing protein n=1 Tax=Salarias fasciatus TaxID=181472 RepID=A0A672I3K0_SALFA
ATKFPPKLAPSAVMPKSPSAACRSQTMSLRSLKPRMRKPPAHPSRALMIKEAIKSLDSRKGGSSQLKHLVRNSLKKGLEKDSLVRPADSTVTAGAMAKFRKSKVENTDPNVKKAPKAAEDEPKPKKGGIVLMLEISLHSAKSEDERVPISIVKKASQKAAEGGSAAAAATFATAAA